ncbi:hypothetical protein KIPB_014205, partial [Kipferlia bialata]|eukprot:g14205.t1
MTRARWLLAALFLVQLAVYSSSAIVSLDLGQAFFKVGHVGTSSGPGNTLDVLLNEQSG